MSGIFCTFVYKGSISHFTVTVIPKPPHQHQPSCWPETGATSISSVLMSLPCAVTASASQTAVSAHGVGGLLGHLQPKGLGLTCLRLPSNRCLNRATWWPAGLMGSPPRCRTALQNHVLNEEARTGFQPSSTVSSMGIFVARQSQWEILSTAFHIPVFLRFLKQLSVGLVYFFRTSGPRSSLSPSKIRKTGQQNKIIKCVCPSQSLMIRSREGMPSIKTLSQ